MVIVKVVSVLGKKVTQVKDLTRSFNILNINTVSPLSFLAFRSLTINFQSRKLHTSALVFIINTLNIYKIVTEMCLPEKMRFCLLQQTNKSYSLTSAACITLPFSES